MEVEESDKDWATATRIQEIPFESKSDFSEQKKYKCNFQNCDAQFSHKCSLVTHQRIHTGEKPYECAVEGCTARFNRSHHLKTHKLTHTGKRPYVCTFSGCNASFNRKHHLQYHERTHMSEKPNKPFACDYDDCDQRFYDNQGLNIHKRTHTGEKPYMCAFEGCDVRFRRSHHLKNHEHTHTDEKPYVCEVDGCDAAYRQGAHLIKHRRSHTGEKPYICTFGGCDAKFARKDYLQFHEYTHTGEKPYLCDQGGCGASFRQPAPLRKHKKLWHTEEGIRKRLKKQYDVQLYLQKHDIYHDSENYVDFKCAKLQDTCKKYARVDFVILQPEIDTVFLLEVDEDQHKYANGGASCEVQRMNDIFVSLSLNQDNNRWKHYVWIRYNPDKFANEGITCNVDSSSRKQRLHEILLNYKPENPIELVYMYYDVRYCETRNVNIPIVFDDADYNKFFQTYLTQCIVE